MTYKDHGEIALILKSHLQTADGIELPIKSEDDHPYHFLTALVEDIADYCEEDNPRFNRDRFMIAVGIGIV